ncbi:MAG: 3-phosphoserine/phosphohydroxythreonine aminotransferase [Sphingobacteriales bacterium BACL12 MAG-120813-bin55]|nr:MAG: 3-phosphoserine/phosphohydroxythreonine aminotransferase [Sphingobacteriales bacterium BACL12 MAG-120802-bin5]KRP13704.1 MAG: 3-phosphoserine/phosphohydroxythreonine aminotransferase [Sphingobacteriales bacterium BACL12 MAG-120813-bin55]
MRVHNFNAGPAILPESALAEASEAIKEFNGLGMSILEISHRSKDFQAVIDEATTHIKELMRLPDNYSVLFLQGGASTQFTMVPMNLLKSGETAGYVNTGTWSKKAIKEAKLFGNVQVLASSEESTFNYIPKGYDIPDTLKYLHLTSNNTIYGTQYQNFPSSKVPVVVDMSSDIFSKEMDYTQFDLIYAGAQKNLGPAGVTLVMINNDLLQDLEKPIPSMLDYRTHISNGSLYNTPPVFSIYMCMLTLRWLKNNGGLAAMEHRNREKADLLYNAIDASPLFKGTVAVEDRSIMNVNFIMENRELEPAFLQYAKERQCVGLAGHRSVGGFRASIYNALPLSSVAYLVELMDAFTKENA